MQSNLSVFAVYDIMGKAHIIAFGSLELCNLIAGGSGIIARDLFKEELELAKVFEYEVEICQWLPRKRLLTAIAPSLQA
jgi:hypothetical protein